VKNSKNAKYVEGCVGFNEMKTFICLNKEDTLAFYKKVKEEQKLVINVSTRTDNSLEAYQPRRPISEYK